MLRRWIAAWLCATLLFALAPVAGASTAQETHTTLTFAWEGLPSLDAQANDALKSLLKAAEVHVRWAEGCWALDVLLQEVSVLDVSVALSEGVYREQSNLWGGKTIAFLPGETDALVEHLLPLTQAQWDAVPHGLRALVAGLVAVGGQPAALPQTEVPRPTVYLPARYGRRAVQTDLLAGGHFGAVWETLAYREVFDAGEALVVRQAQGESTGGTSFVVEWAQENGSMGAVYVQAAADAHAFSLLASPWEGGLLAEWAYRGEAFALEGVTARRKTVQAQSGRESATIETDWMLQSDALFGEGNVRTISMRTESARGRSGTRQSTTRWYCADAGQAPVHFLTMTEKTVTQDATAPVQTDTVWPARMDEAALADWRQEQETALTQAVLTVLGRLPADVAAYLLERME